MHVDAGGLRLWVAHHGGDAAGVPMLLLHGFSGSAASWQPVLPALAMHGRAVALDLVGHGRSGAPREPGAYAMPAVVAQLLAVLDQLGIAQADWIGYSMGGRIALHAVLAAPARVRRLVLEGCSPGIADAKEREARRAQDEAWAQRIEREGAARFAEAWLAQPLFASQRARGEAWMRDAVRARSGHKPRGLAMAMRGLGQGAQEPLWGKLPEVRAPALLVAGELDGKHVGLARAMAQRMPLAEVAVIPRAGHEAHAEEPDAWVAPVLSHLERLPP